MTVPQDAQSRGRRITKRLVGEAGSARQSWSIFEAFNGADEQSRSTLLDGVNRLCLQRTVHGFLHALARDTIMTLMRITDQPGQDNLVLCKLSALLRDPDTAAKCVGASLFSNPNLPAEFARANAEGCRSAIKALTDLVPAKWDEKSPPVDRRLYDHREKMRPIRDKILAHSGDSEAIAMPVINEIREFLALTSQLVQHAELIFSGSAPNWSSDLKIRLREATEFWDVCQTGFGADVTGL